MHFWTHGFPLVLPNFLSLFKNEIKRFSLPSELPAEIVNFWKYFSKNQSQKSIAREFKSLFFFDSFLIPLILQIT
jgi:hypothetical protein